MLFCTVVDNYLVVQNFKEFFLNFLIGSFCVWKPLMTQEPPDDPNVHLARKIEREQKSALGEFWPTGVQPWLPPVSPTVKL